ncbi:MAG: TSUP family transporter [Methanococcaceae archaeon]
MNLNIFTLIILFFTGLIAGLVDAIAGGGGLITIPVFLSLGFPPHLALGTNKFQASFGSFTASAYYLKKGDILLKNAAWGIFFTLIGSACGTYFVQQISGDLLKNIIPFLLVGIIIYSLLTPRLGEIDKHSHMPQLFFYFLFGITLGFYDGFFGPGVGSFWAIAFVILLGYNLTKATGYTKIMNFTSNIVSLVIFIIGGHVVFTAGLVMAVGQILGSRIGAGLVIKKGAKFIRPIFITMVILTTLKLLYSRFF